MRNPAVVWEGIKNIFVEFSGRWIIVFEAIFLFIVIYYVLRTLQNNNAKRLIPVYTALVLLAGVICLFSEHLSVEVFYIFLMLTSLFFLLLFSIDIKRSIWNSNKRTGKTVSDVAAKKNGPNTVKADACIAAIVRAVQNLSKNNIGALIVFSNGNLPKDIVDSGIALGANISSQLIEGIFIPKAPLHDGAMIIVGDKIPKSPTFPPLSCPRKRASFRSSSAARSRGIWIRKV